MLVKTYKSGRILMARPELDADIIDRITSLAENYKISTGFFNCIGALKQAELAFYDQHLHEYRSLPVNGPVELVSCTGNVSIKGDKTFVHAHAVLAGPDGRTVGGHLNSGRIFAAELCLQEILGEPLVREPDQNTGLYLWKESKGPENPEGSRDSEAAR